MLRVFIKKIIMFIVSSVEDIMIIKTLLKKEKVEEILKNHHPYTIPFITQIKTGETNKDYLEWAKKTYKTLFWCWQSLIISYFAYVMLTYSLKQSEIKKKMVSYWCFWISIREIGSKNCFNIKRKT